MVFVTSEKACFTLRRAMSSSTSNEGSHLTVLVKEDEDEEDVNPFADPSLTAASVHDVVPKGASSGEIPRPRLEEKPRDPHAPPGNLSGLFGFGGGHVAASFSSHYRLEDETGMLGEGTIDDEALARKARELDKKEAELRVREDAYDEISATLEKRPNWPSCRPVLYHDIRAEVAEENRGMVTAAYMTWMLASFGYCLNFLVITLNFTIGGSGIGDWFFACLFAAAGVPISFQTWYRVLYNAGKRTRHNMFTSAQYIRFFVHFFFHFLMVVWMLASIPVVGTMCAGVITTMLIFSNADGAWDEFVGFLSFLNVLVWAAVGFSSLYVGGRAMTRFRTGGGPADVRRGVQFSGALIR